MTYEYKATIVKPYFLDLKGVRAGEVRTFDMAVEALFLDGHVFLLNHEEPYFKLAPDLPLGPVNAKILVQLFASPDEEAVEPYIQDFFQRFCALQQEFKEPEYTEYGQIAARLKLLLEEAGVNL